MLTIADVLCHAFREPADTFKYSPLYYTQHKKDVKWCDRHGEDQQAYLNEMLDDEGWWSASIWFNGKRSTIKFQIARRGE